MFLLIFAQYFNFELIDLVYDLAILKAINKLRKQFMKLLFKRSKIIYESIKIGLRNLEENINEEIIQRDELILSDKMRDNKNRIGVGNRN